jgi:hypothetical protein
MNVPKNALFTAVVVALIANGPRLARAENLVQNGDFSSNTGLGQIGYETTVSNWTSPTPYAFNFIVDAHADSTGFPSQNSPPNIFIWGPNTGYNSGLNSGFVDVSNGFTAPPNGDTNWLGMDGAYNTGPMDQTVNGLTVGTQYTLSFYWAASQFAIGASNSVVSGPTTQYITASLDSDSATTSTINLPSQGFSGWMQFSTTFTASSTSETLSLLAGGSPAGLPPFLMVSGVDLEPTTPSVPEPSSLTLWAGCGLMMAAYLCWARRPRRSIA